MPLSHRRSALDAGRRQVSNCALSIWNVLKVVGSGMSAFEAEKYESRLSTHSVHVPRNPNRFRDYFTNLKTAPDPPNAPTEPNRPL